MAKKKFDPKAKEKKQKMIAIGGGVLLLLVVGLEAPSTLKKMSQKAPPPPVVNTGATSTTPTPAGAPGAPLAPPSLDGSTDPTLPAPASTDSGTAVAASAPAGTIASFDRFASKDPFTQQVKPSSDGGAGTGTAAPVTPTTGTGGAGATPVAPTPPTVTPIPPGGTPATPSVPTTTPTPAVPLGPPPTTARISVNGVAEDVGVGKDFPAANPTFHLVSLSHKGAKIAIAGGSYSDGAPTVTLLLHKTLNLQNTSDGTVFTLKLLLLDPLSGAGSATPAAPVTTTSDPSAGLSP